MTITTLALRFRDLSTKETIAKHQSLIERDGFVWWGWWSKPGENVPETEFALLTGMNNATVLLLDSGRKLLYEADVAEIKFADDGSDIPSPDPDKTPPYYSTVEFKAWFRFTSITQIDTPETHLQKFSYDEVANFVDDPQSPRFDSKQVASIEEMLARRHRTIWFLQDYKEGDRDGEVIIELAAAPQSFMTEAVRAKSNLVVMISDLHFGKTDFPSSAGEVTKVPLEIAIAEDLKAYCEENGLGPKTAPALVVVCGDYLWQADKAAEGNIQAAIEFLESLRSQWSLEWHNFLLAPGNHDVDWEEYPAEKEGVVRPSSAAFEPFRKIFKSFVGIAPDATLTSGRKILLDNYIPVEAIAISSCGLIQKDYANFGWVDLSDLDFAAEQMGWEKTPSQAEFRLLLSHHHLLPATPRESARYDAEYSISLNAKETLGWCQRHGVHFAVHGHAHSPALGLISDPNLGEHQTLVVANGSAGVASSERAIGLSNSYTIMDIARDHVKVSVRNISPDQTGLAQPAATRVPLPTRA